MRTEREREREREGEKGERRNNPTDEDKKNYVFLYCY
jgi:hypothetical protein